MSTTLKFEGTTAIRTDTVDHAEGDKVRDVNRDMVGIGKAKDSNSPFNEAWTFTYEEYELLKVIKPHLFDETLDPITRRNHWVAFSHTTEGRSFRVR